MTPVQRTIKYCAIAFAVFLSISIIGGIIGALASVSMIFGSKSAAGETKNYTISKNITDLNIDISATELEIKSGESFFVESNHKNLTVKEKDGCLKISEKKPFWGFSTNSIKLIVTIPRDMVFNTANVETGAGRVYVETLNAKNLNLSLGAGKADFENLYAENYSKIDGGAGKLTVKNGSLANLKLDMGVGKLNLCSALLGDCEFDMGVGGTDVTLLGAKEDYQIKLSKGIGKATVDGIELGDGAVYDDGINKIEIDGGVGAINVNFQDK